MRGEEGEERERSILGPLWCCVCGGEYVEYAVVVLPVSEIDED